MDVQFDSQRLRVAAVVVATAFLAGAIGFVLGTADERVPSETDLGFAQDMITHHEQAVGMAQIALDQADSSTIRIFASEVIISQMREIGLLDSFLDRWGQLRKNRDEPVMAWMGMPMPLEEMPGYADEIELRALRETTGPEFDSLFLTLLAAHHVGGTQMAAFAADNARNGDVAALAEIIARNQSIEIAEYGETANRLMLPSIPGAPTFAEYAELARLAKT